MGADVHVRVNTCLKRWTRGAVPSLTQNRMLCRNICPDRVLYRNEIGAQENRRLRNGEPFRPNRHGRSTSREIQPCRRCRWSHPRLHGHGCRDDRDRPCPATVRIHGADKRVHGEHPLPGGRSRNPDDPSGRRPKGSADAEEPFAPEGAAFGNQFWEARSAGRRRSRLPLIAGYSLVEGHCTASVAGRGNHSRSRERLNSLVRRGGEAVGADCCSAGSMTR